MKNTRCAVSIVHMANLHSAPILFVINGNKYLLLYFSTFKLGSCGSTQTRRMGLQGKRGGAIRAVEDWLLVCEEDHEITLDPYGIAICSLTATEVFKAYGRHLVNTWIDVPNETCSPYIEALITADGCK